MFFSTLQPSYHPTTTPTEISEAIRMLDESHKQQIMEYKLRMDALQKEYLKERQDLSTKLLQAIRSHEVCTEPVNFYPPGSSSCHLEQQHPDLTWPRGGPGYMPSSSIENNPSSATVTQIVTVTQQNTTTASLTSTSPLSTITSASTTLAQPVLQAQLQQQQPQQSSSGNNSS